MLAALLAASAVWWLWPRDGDVFRSPVERDAPAAPLRVEEPPAPPPEARPEPDEQPPPVRTVRLEVVDGETGAPLSGIEVEPSTPAIRDAASPVRVPTGHRYRVDAAGYAAADVRVPADASGPVRVELQRAGVLEVHLVDLRPGSGAVVELRRDDEWVRSVEPSEPGPTTLPDLAAGPYDVRVEVPRRFRADFLLGRATVEIPAAGRGSVTIRLRTPPPPGVPFGGTIAVPDAWGDVNPDMSVFCQDGPTARHTSLERHGSRWSAGRVPPDRYHVRVKPFGMQVAFDVGAGGLEDARIEIPPPADVIVRVRDAEDRPVPGAELDWYVPPGHTYMTVRPNPEDGLFRFRAPQGRLVLEPEAIGFDSGARLVRVRPGRNEFRLRIRRLTTVRVRFRRDGEVKERPPGVFVRVEPVGHEGEYLGVNTTSTDRTITMSTPGRYRVTFDVPDGFRAIPPKELDLPLGVTDLVVDLVGE